MSRSGYNEDCEQWSVIRWRGQVAAAIRGKRGQRLLLDIVKALDAMPDKRLVTGELVREDGEVCTLGAVAVRRGIVDKLAEIDPDDSDSMGDVGSYIFDAAHQL